VDCLRDRVGHGHDQLRVPADDLASEIGKALRPPFARVPIDCDVLSFDFAQPAQLVENRLIKPTSSGVAYASDGT
jgi:hypothetical protein